MPWLLDTNHWIFLLKGRCLPLQEKLRGIAPDEVWLCSVVKEELFYGAEGYDDKAARLAKLENLFARHASAPFDDEAAAIAGRIRKELEGQRQVIGPHDIQIAAIALQHGWTLVTNNVQEFKRVAGLAVEDWTV
ncbi:type II toxin-antitoxin system VapC family toxin [Prosthecobacter fluviatilis]|uniref:Ribonuclease VapC n=1 Tax=Prosthecobacter fluviatilis TaxID=445931 RepID=A0ABW0KNJ2_9BACT